MCVFYSVFFYLLTIFKKLGEMDLSYKGDSKV